MGVSVDGSPFFGRLLLSATCRLRGLNTLDVLKEIERTPFLPADEIRQRQFQKLSTVLAHAEAHVPYYRGLFRSLGIGSSDIRSWGDFAKLPILTKDVLREKENELAPDDAPAGYLRPHFSGGSTGIPVRFYRSREYMIASDAGTYRNLMQCGWRPGDMVAFFWGGNDKLYAMSKWEFELRQFVRRSYQFDPFFAGDDDMSKWIRIFQRIKPKVILGYASTVARFASFLDSKGQTVGQLKGVFTTAEKLYRPQREVMERVFGCKVFDCYGSAEIQNIAAECPQGNMHINADFVVLEEQKTEGDGPRPFLLTSLRNFATTFIRYRNEDCGYLANGVCSCGNHFPLIKLEIARTSDNFVFPNGRVIHGEFFTHLMYGSAGIANFQFHQTAIDKIVLSIVPGSGDSQSRKAKIQEAIRQVQAISPDHPIELEVREVPVIELSTAGKHRFTKSDVKPDASFESTAASKTIS